MQGKHVGHYEIVSRLGEGGMGTVYQARDLLLGREVAIKALPATRVADPGLRARFIREAQAASALNHPNIITIYDVVQEDDADYLVMELVEGLPLNAAIPAGGMQKHRAIDFAIQIGDALGAAHAAGIVHRDLKPANIMVRPDGRVKVLDFGLAKWVDDRSEESRATELTQAGQVLGTVSYMSPEQVRGEAVDHRSDIFSVGIVLYQLLTGVLPFSGSSVAHRLHAIGFEDPQPLGEHRADADEFVPLLEHALAKNVETRFQSMGEFVDALRGLQAGRTHEFTVPLQPLSGPRATGRRKWWIPALVLVLLAPLALPQVRHALFGSPDRGPGRPPLVTAFDRFQYGRELLDHYYREGAIDEAIEVLQEAVEAEPEYAPAYSALAEAFWRKYRDEFDRVWLDRALAHADQAVGFDPHLSSARAMRGLVRAARGEDDLARADFDSTLVVDPNNADAWRGIGDLALSAGDSATAHTNFDRAVELRGGDQELHGRLGVLFYMYGDYARAEDSFRRSTELAPDNFGAYRNLGAVQHMLGDYGSAAASLQRALEIRPDASVYANLGTLYFFQGLYPQARGALEKALSLGANQHLVWGNLGDVYRFLPDRQQEAHDAFVRAHQLVRGEIDADPEDLWLRGLSAEYLAKQGEVDAARAELEQLDAREEVPADVWYDVSQAWEAIGERDEALAALDRALRGGYGLVEVRNDPEFTELRKDVRYHQLRIPYDRAD